MWPPERENNVVRIRDFKPSETLGPDSTLSGSAGTGACGGGGTDRNEDIGGFACLAGTYILYKTMAANVKRRFPLRRAAGSEALLESGNKRSRDR